MTSPQSLLTVPTRAVIREIATPDICLTELLDSSQEGTNVGPPRQVQFLLANFTDETGEAKHNTSSVTSHVDGILGLTLIKGNLKEGSASKLRGFGPRSIFKALLSLGREYPG